MNKNKLDEMFGILTCEQVEQAELKMCDWHWSIDINLIIVLTALAERYLELPVVGDFDKLSSLIIKEANRRSEEKRKAKEKAVEQDMRRHTCKVCSFYPVSIGGDNIARCSGCNAWFNVETVK
jgi:hypothetical protein